MNIKLDNMVDLRAFCLEQAIKFQSGYCKAGHIIAETACSLAREYEQYILGDATLPTQPFNSDKFLYEAMDKCLKEKG